MYRPTHTQHAARAVNAALACHRAQFDSINPAALDDTEYCLDAVDPCTGVVRAFTWGHVCASYRPRD